MNANVIPAVLQNAKLLAFANIQIEKELFCFVVD